MTLNDAIHSEKATLTFSETAQILGCDPRTVSRGCVEGAIPSISMGRRRMIPRLALLKMLGYERGPIGE